MFFRAKKLMAQKQQLDDKIEGVYQKMDDTFLSLSESLQKFYPDFECFDLFDLTIASYWFGDIAFCYDGDNEDLSNALYNVDEDLGDIEAENLSNEQVICIYNVFTFLLNDLYSTEEPILQSNLSKHAVLDRFKALTQKLISYLNADQSTSAEKMCVAVQKFYTLLDFSLYDSPKHKQLRELKNQYLQILSAGYNLIDRYKEEIEQINKQLEKHNYSEEGKKISKKEISPFPTLKAYNNAIELFTCCMQAVEKYEQEGGLVIPSCTNDIKKEIFAQLIESKDEFDEWDSSVNFEKVAHTILAHTTFDMLASGRYHLYARILNPMNCSANLMLIYDKAMDYGVKIGMVTKDEQAQQRAYLLECISEVG